MVEERKTWTDAIREKYLDQADDSPAAGWEVIERHLRRATMLRRTTIAAAAVLLSFAALLLWSH